MATTGSGSINVETKGLLFVLWELYAVEYEEMASAPHRDLNLSFKVRCIKF
ncbi:hypothetical protein IFM89_008255 [Coptis chinensis]|uniref:Uncharacterized protein n=1 Tax=Coptis chinensis TaxID=261450 RepID=A0A835I8D4_9MAGN|nr:hypothetical protein IFM89_008255 [Coptis chinensis]